PSRAFVEVPLDVVSAFAAFTKRLPQLQGFSGANEKRRVGPGRSVAIPDLVFRSVSKQRLPGVATTASKRAIARRKQKMVRRAHQTGEERTHALGVSDDVVAVTAKLLKTSRRLGAGHRASTGNQGGRSRRVWLARVHELL